MDIFGILDPDPDPHKNLGGSGTLLLRHLWKFSKRHDSIHTERQEFETWQDENRPTYPDPVLNIVIQVIKASL